MKALTWKQRLDKAKEMEEFTEEDKRLAEYWRSCAIGEKFGLGIFDSDILATYSLYKAAGPDSHTYTTSIEMGRDFCSAVTVNDVDAAIKCYKQIQKLKVK